MNFPPEIPKTASSPRLTYRRLFAADETIISRNGVEDLEIACEYLVRAYTGDKFESADARDIVVEITFPSCDGAKGIVMREKERLATEAFSHPPASKGRRIAQIQLRECDFILGVIEDV